MSVYTTTSSESENSTYENLQGRILFAIAQSINNSKDVLGIPNKKNPNGDGILAVRMHSDVPYANSNNSNNYGGGGGNVSSINSSAQETNNTNGLAFLSNIPMIPILISMGILLLVVLALFISTSRPSKRQRRSNNDAAGNTKEETATIMSAKTIDIDLDAGEEVELQSTASSAFSLRGVEVDDDYYDENMQNGGGTTNRTPSHKSSKKGITPKRNRSIGGIGAVVTNGLRRNVSPRRQRSSESDGGDGIGGAGGGPSTPNSLMYSSASLPSPTQRTPVRSKKTSTMAKTDASTPPTGVSTIQSTPQRTPKPTLRSVPRTPRAITPDVEVELYDCLFPNSPGGAISCQSRNSLLGTPSSSARRGQQQQQQQQTKTQTRSTYLDMLATTFCSNPQNYDDVEVCLRPVDDCTECVENEFCSPLPTTITPCSMNKNKVVQVKEKERSTKNVVVPSKAVPNYVFANEDNDDGGNGGVGSTTMNRDDRMTSQVNIIPNYVFAEKDGGDSGIKSKQERMKKSNAKVARKEEKESNGGIFRETFESKFGDPCGGGGRFLKRGRDRPDIDADISIAEIREIYSYDDDKYRRRGSARKKDPPAKKEEHVAEVSSTDGCVAGYNPTTACNDNWFFDWW